MEGSRNRKEKGWILIKFIIRSIMDAAVSNNEQKGAHTQTNVEVSKGGFVWNLA